MAKQWQLQAGGFSIEYTVSGYRLRGHVKWEQGAWFGAANVEPEPAEGRAGVFATISSTQEIGEAMAAVEALAEELCARLRGSECK